MDWVEELGNLPSGIISPGRECSYNHSADGVAGWADEDASRWLRSVRLGCEDLPVERVCIMTESDSPPCEVGSFILMETGLLYYGRNFARLGPSRYAFWRHASSHTENACSPCNDASEK